MGREIVVTNKAEERQKLVSALIAFAAENDLPEKVVQAADLALEEHLTNILDYAYEDPSEHKIHVRLDIANGSLLVEVEDDGKPFNPLTAPPADISSPLAERRLGGLGIHLMRKSMDDMAYRREGCRNILTMRKTLAAVAG